MYKINYLFYINVDENGEQSPAMALGPMGDVQHLSHLAIGRMSKSLRIKEILNKIDNVLSNELEGYRFSGDDWCIVDFKKEKTIVGNPFSEFEPFEMDSNLILKLMQDWYAFLVKWEHNEIPGLIYPKNK